MNPHASSQVRMMNYEMHLTENNFVVTSFEHSPYVNLTTETDCGTRLLCYAYIMSTDQRYVHNTLSELHQSFEGRFLYCSAELGAIRHSIYCQIITSNAKHRRIEEKREELPIN